MQLGAVLTNRYKITSQLSQKAGRSTFVALDTRSQQRVIIKLLSFDTEFRWDDLKLFEREAATLQNLSHPAIPQYLDYFEVDEGAIRGFALVQTYIDAPSLEAVIKQGRKFSESEVIELATRLLDILAYLHEQHPPVIHRDIKPSNILLANRSGNSIGEVYLVDFGSVQTAATKEEGTITIVGSYGYIPLEQFGGQTTLASDLYSLGMTLIYLITGTHPAELPLVNGQVKFTAEISNQLKRWLERMTQPYLEKRFDSAKVARTALVSEDGSYGDFINLKPANSQVQLYRDRDRLEIRWQDIDLEKVAKLDRIAALPVNSIGWLFSGVFIFGFLGMICAAISSLASGFLLGISSLSFFGVFFIAFVLTPIASTIVAIIQRLMKPIDYMLAIDDQYIYYCKSTQSRDKFKIRSHSQRAPADILVYNPGYAFDQYLDGDATVTSRGRVTVNPKLYLYCGGVEYELSRNKLSQAESMWLGKELSDFLNLELQIIYPTPRVPPAPSCGGGC